MYLIQMGILNAHFLYSKYHPTVRKIPFFEFLKAAANHLIFFDVDEWPSTEPPIPSAPDLPVDERQPIPRQRRPVRPVSDEEDADDPLPAAAAVADPVASTSSAVASTSSPPLPSTPLTTSTPISSPPPPPPPTEPDLAAPRSRSPTPPPVVEQPPVKRMKLDPDCRLQKGKHEVMRLTDHLEYDGVFRKRCRVCIANGIRRESRFCCSLCNMPLCATAMSNCFRRYHTEAQY